MSWWHHKWWPMMAGVDVENGTGHVAATLVVAASFAWEDDWAAGVVVRRLVTTWRCEVAGVGDRTYWTEWERESGSYGLEREMVDRPRDKKKRKRKELLIWGWFEKIARVFLREFFPPDLLFFFFHFSPPPPSSRHLPLLFITTGGNPFGYPWSATKGCRRLRINLVHIWTFKARHAGICSAIFKNI